MTEKLTAPTAALLSLMMACESSDIQPSIPVEELRLNLAACLPEEGGEINFMREPVTSGSILQVALGPQGGCHVWMQLNLEGNMPFRDVVQENQLPVQVSIQSEEDLSVQAGDPTENRYPKWTYLGDADAVSSEFMAFVMDGANYADPIYCIDHFTERKGPHTLIVQSPDSRVEEAHVIEDVYLQL